VILRLDSDVPSSEHLAGEFERRKVLARLQALDSKARRRGVAGLEPALNELIRIGMEAMPGGAVARNCYGLFHLSWLAPRHPEWPSAVLNELDEVKAAIKAEHRVPLKYVIWAGAGGSIEDKAMYLASDLLKRGPKQYILDSTDPVKLKAILADIKRRSSSLESALKSTLVVGLAMEQATHEAVLNLEKLAALYDELGIESKPNILCLARSGSALDELAARRGYIQAAVQLDGGDTTTGRHSAPMSRSSLYALGLAGTPLGDWIGATYLSKGQIQTAFRLAAFLHQQGLSGRDKVTLVLSPTLKGAAHWTKQNVEGSLAKTGETGIKIVIGEPLRMADYRAPKDPRQDRVFLLVSRKGEPAAAGLKTSLLRRCGYPLASLAFAPGASLSQYLQFIHYVVFALGWLRETNFVTQPGVDECTSLTNSLYQNSVFQGGIANTVDWKNLHDSQRQIRGHSGLVLHYDHLPCGFQLSGRTAASAYAALVHQLAAAGVVEYGELAFFGDTRYDAAGIKLRRILERAAGQLFRDGLSLPADVAEGPAVNHSCHEMVVGHGRCLSTLLISEKAESIAGVGCGADYHRAQFLANLIAQERRARLVVSITLRDLSEPSLRSLEEFFREAAAHIRRSR